MKSFLRKICSPILSIFEQQEGEYSYKPSHRLILKIVGSLFFILSTASLLASLKAGELGALLPVVVFFGVGLVCMVVGFLGTDRAVARIWNSR